VKQNDEAATKNRTQAFSNIALFAQKEQQA